MSDDSLDFYLRMHDEASATMRDASKAVNEHADSHTKAARAIGEFSKAHDDGEKHVGSWRQAIRAATGEADGFFGAIRNVAGEMLKFGAPIAGGIVAAKGLEEIYHTITETIKEMVQATMAQEKAQYALNHAFSITGDRNGLSKGQIDGTITKTSEDYNLNKTSLTQASTTLIQLGNVAGDTFQPAIEMAVRLSQVMNTDVTSAAHMLARVLEDPISGMTRLQRVGVYLTDQQKELIRSTTMAGDVLKTQAVAIGVLEEKLGRASSADSKAGLVGAVTGMQTAWHELMLSFDDSALEYVIAGLTRHTAAVIADTAAEINHFRTVMRHPQMALPGFGIGARVSLPAMAQADEAQDFNVNLPRQIGTAAAALGDTQAKITALEARIARSKTEVEKAMFKPELALMNMQLQGQQTTVDTLSARWEKMGGVARSVFEMVGHEVESAVTALKDLGDAMPIEKFKTAAAQMGMAFNVGKDGKSELMPAALAKAMQEETDNTNLLGTAKRNLDSIERMMADGRAKGGEAEKLLALRREEYAKADQLAAVARQKMDDLDKASKEGKLALEERARIGLSVAAQDRDREIKKNKEAGDSAYPGDAVRSKKYADSLTAKYDEGKNLSTANANAAVSREVQEQYALAEAYMKSAQAGAKLKAEQQAGNNAADGKGDTDAGNIQSKAFGAAYVSAAEGLAKGLVDVDAAARKAAAAADPVAAAYEKATAAAIKQGRDLALLAVTDDQRMKAKIIGEKLITDAVQKDYSAQIAAMSDMIAKNAETNALDKVKIANAGKSQLDQTIAIANQKVELALQIAINDANGDSVKIAAAKKTAEAARASNTATAGNDRAAALANGAISKFISEGKDQAEQYQQVAVKAFTGVEDAMVSAMQTGKDFGAAMKSVLDSVIADMAKMAIRAAITGPLMQAAFGSGGLMSIGGSNPVGSVASSASGGIVGGLFGKAATWASSFFADGGIMTSAGSVPLRKYSGGGIANSPQAAIFGEGDTPEAYVPVPSGRIPVELKGGGGKGGGVSISTNVTINMAPAASGGSSKTGGAGTGNQARDIGSMVTALVNKNLTDNLRPGGILNPTGSLDTRGAV
jgi:hypothetical protein